MNYQERRDRASACDQRQNDAGIRQEEDSVRQEKEVVTGILQKFGVEQALMDVRTNVWGEGKITECPNGLALQSDPFLTVGTSWDHPRGLLKKRSFIPITIPLEVSVRAEVDLRRSETFILITDLGESKIHFQRSILNGEKTVGDNIREHGWEDGINKLFILPGHGPSYDDLLQGIQARIDVNQNNSVEIFNSELKAIIEGRRRHEVLPSQLRERWQKIIYQFPPALREKGKIGVNELEVWERELRGPNILQRARLLFSGRPSQPTRV